ncbi:radical SAM protein [Motiliproteus coralliicola]|uniref:Radical SAM protein n=1 Tax=Motiliproteus coralliicola TaxID=2283196 RepID=A0A369WB40_9GAMM|nr:radical SAM protein [Motiliproteus coralliicola]RDE18379.1 radical SAM protein [Motiliproteus coralliicola]
MKALLIKASANSAFKDYKAYLGTPPQSIWSSAVAIPDWVEVDVHDETSQGPVDKSQAADLVAIFMSTPDALRGYELADYFRDRGTTVVFGGLHASFLPDEALQHGDAVMIGESEQLWPQLLEDHYSGQLQPRYQQAEQTDLSRLTPYPHSQIDLSPYRDTSSIIVSRGCKFKCSYCTVHKFFPTMRNRPVGQVIDEIRASGLQYFELHADNLIADRDYALELFKALKPLNIYWSAEATINIAEHDDIVEAAAESGLIWLLSGIETPSQQALKAAGKGFIRIDRTRDYIRKLHEYNIAVDSAMLFGFDQHDSTIFEETLDYVDEVELDVCHAVIVTPYPGTDLYQQLETEQRILTRDWSAYDGTQAVFQPKQMTPKELEKGTGWFHSKYNSLGRSLKRRVVRTKNLGWTNAAYL